MDSRTKGLILLNMLQDIGSIRLKTLLDEFSSPEAVFEAPKKRLESLKGIGPKTADSIINARSTCDLDKELALIERNKVRIITIFDKYYPNNLKTIYDPPPVLYIKGDIIESDEAAVAVVGSRRASLYGLRMAQKIGTGLGMAQVTVISGMARGIDTSAHKGALSVKARTIAVLGNGLDIIYPPENERLAQDIISNGALISEFPMQMPPHKSNFPMRNRIISGLSKGVVVVEAAKRSGSLITADLALHENREVFAVPGAAGVVTSEGTNNLIREGAHLVVEVKDILEVLGIGDTGTRADNKIELDDISQRQVYHMLSDEPCDIDSIIEGSLLQNKKVQTALLGLEMKGLIRQLPGKLYVRSDI